MRALPILALPPLLVGAPLARQNDVPLNNGAETALTFSDPSSGAPPGTPPDLAGDLFWKVLPGDRVMHAPDGSLEITGFLEYFEETSWSTPNHFYDRTLGPALPSATVPGALEPAFFQLGLTSEVLVSIGPSGFGNPCTLYPSLITTCVGGCPTVPWAWQVEIAFEGTPLAGLTVPADGTAASHLATTWFVPPGMTTTGGDCGQGTYVLQAAYSTDEMLADDLGGVSPYSGFQLAGVGRFPDAVADTPTNHLHFEEPVLNALADPGGGLVDQGPYAGGALSGLKLPVGGGAARLGVELRDLAGAFVPDLAFAAAAQAALPPPGATVFGGAELLLVPDALTAPTAAVWQGSIAYAIPFWTSEGLYTGATLPVPATLAGLDLFLQGLVLDPQTLSGRATNVRRVSLLP